MSTFAVGDLQGCDAELGVLLDQVGFGDEDELWIAGDLINRGPNSLAVLQRLRSMGSQCRIVLGNHDLHFLAIYFGGHNGGKNDTFDDVLGAPNVEELAHWLRHQKLMHVDAERNMAMTHAGIPHIWSVSQAQALAREVEQVIAGESSALSYIEYFQQMYGNEPSIWDDGLVGMQRARVITNYLTRMRFVNQRGEMNFSHKGLPEETPAGFKPWFHWLIDDYTRAHLLFGHWAALDGVTGRQDLTALDTGCVWGRRLTAVNVDTLELHHVDAKPR